MNRLSPHVKHSVNISVAAWPVSRAIPERIVSTSERASG